MRVTQKDIARKLGVSPSLVSRSLGGTAHAIGADSRTIQRIRKEAAACGYVPSAVARQLRGHGQPVLGLVVADLEDPFFGPAVAEVIRQSHRAGYALALASFEQRKPRLEDVEILLQQDLRALLVLGSGPIDWVKPFVRRGLHIVRIGTTSTPAIPHVTEVSVDIAQGFELVVHHLTELGHREFAFVGAGQEIHQRRLPLVRAALKRHRLNLPAGRAVFANPDVLDAGLPGIKQLERTAGRPFPTAIICSSDAVALGALRGLARAGYRVPEHISVTGFDDLALARLSTPPLTSVRQPLADLVKDALRVVAEGRAARAPSPRRLHLMLRGSTGPAWNP